MSVIHIHIHNTIHTHMNVYECHIASNMANCVLRYRVTHVPKPRSPNARFHNARGTFPCRNARADRAKWPIPCHERLQRYRNVLSLSIRELRVVSDISPTAF